MFADMSGRKRSLAAWASWVSLSALLGACSFLAPKDGELTGGTRFEAHIDGSTSGNGGSGASDSIAVRQPGTSSGGRSAGGASSNAPPAQMIRVDSGMASASPDATLPPGLQDAAPTVRPDAGSCGGSLPSCPSGCANTTVDPSNFGRSCG